MVVLSDGNISTGKRNFNWRNGKCRTSAFVACLRHVRVIDCVVTFYVQWFRLGSVGREREREKRRTDPSTTRRDSYDQNLYNFYRFHSVYGFLFETTHSAQRFYRISRYDIIDDIDGRITDEQQPDFNAL